MSEEFIVPEFLTGQEADAIMERMVEAIPRDIDVSQGNHAYNLLMPTALEKEMYANYIIAESIKLIFPKYCEGYDDVVDDHAETNGIYRKEAFYAVGELTATGEPGTAIPVGSVFSTASTDDSPSMEFESTSEVTIGDDRIAFVPIQALDAGTVGNVAAGTIIMQDNPIDDLEGVINEKATSGGVDQETTESLIKRIVEYQQSQGLSFVGNISDYKRWSEEVNGTGVATVIEPAEGDDSGLITIVLTDNIGKPATEKLCQDVYNHIVRPDSPAERFAPINGANIRVVPPVTIDIRVSATVDVKDESTLDIVKTEFIKNVNAYMAVVPNDREIKYSKVYSILAETAGVNDISDVLMNEGVVNIEIDLNEFPQVTAGSITFTEAESI